MVDDIIARVERYYSARFAEHGATAAGVDWNSDESQQRRFDQLMRITRGTDGFSLNDYGCGYGALAAFLREEGVSCTYTGYDVSEPMIADATARWRDDGTVSFTRDPSDLQVADFCVASGIFNVRLDIAVADWVRYVLATIDRLATLGGKGFAFNMLTAHADPERMRDDLYYGDPGFFLDYCARAYSRHVALAQDYGLWEFTVIVRKTVP